MGSGILLSGVAAACSVGMGCGTCCGSGISAFLAGYMMTHAHNFREALGGFLKFYLGKILAVVSICLMTSLAGSRLLSDEGYLGRVPLAKVIDLCMIAAALWMLCDLLLEKSGRKSCAHCSHAGPGEGTDSLVQTPDAQNTEKKISGAAAFLMGAGYGITPCAPLILIAGCCATMPFAHAAVVGAVFACASAVSPMLILLLISGVLAGRMYLEIPKYLDYFRFACYLGVIGYFAYSFFMGSTVVA